MCQMIFLSRKLIHSLIEASLLNPTCIPLVGQKNWLGSLPKTNDDNPSKWLSSYLASMFEASSFARLATESPQGCCEPCLGWQFKKSYTFQKPNHPPNLPIYHLFHPPGKHISFLLVCFTAPPFFTSMLLSSTAPRWHQQRHPPRRCWHQRCCCSPRCRRWRRWYRSTNRAKAFLMRKPRGGLNPSTFFGSQRDFDETKILGWRDGLIT